jgi:hypothetical protein
MIEHAATDGRGAPSHRNFTRSGAAVFLLALAAMVLTTGCQTTKSSVSNLMASIVVTNTPAERIEAAVNEVFTKHSFEEARAKEDELVFQRPGSLMSGLIYGDWYSGGVWERVKIYLRELDPARTVVECDGYMVQQHEDPLFQKEKRQYKTKKGHLQDLLNEVAQELKRPPAAPVPEQPK